MDSIYELINKVYGENQRQFWKFETFTGAHSESFDENIAVYDGVNFSPLTIKEINFEYYSIEISD